MTQVSEPHIDTIICLASFLAYYVHMNETVHDFYLHELYFINT
jgi:hypothetical protein